MRPASRTAPQPVAWRTARSTLTATRASPSDDECSDDAPTLHLHSSCEIRRLPRQLPVTTFAFRIGHQARAVRQALAHDGAQKVQCLDQSRVRKMIGDRGSLAHGVDQAAIAQDLEMPRRRGLSHAELARRGPSRCANLRPARRSSTTVSDRRGRNKSPLRVRRFLALMPV